MKIYLMLTLCVLFWSGNFIIGRSVHEVLEPLELAFFRWGGVFVVVFPFLLFRRKKILSGLKNEPLLILVLGALGIAGFNTFLYIGLHDTTAINALLINSSIPILILFLSRFILQTPITTLQLFGIALSTFGVIYLVSNGELSLLFEFQSNKGDIWIVISSCTWALYSVLVKKRERSLGDFDYFILIVTIGFVILLPLYLLQNYEFSHTKNMLCLFYKEIFYVVFFPSIASYYLWHQGIHHIGSSKTGQFTHLMPLFGTILAVIFLQEKIMLYQLFGFVFIVLGIYFSLFLKGFNKFKL